ncbi:MAG: hypothetical protein KGH65_05705, partial [Candidatus Micrarchaeota archaeon]|nr:hypothetical protein [Candidatus Micrarchaeota archaeon]
MGFFDNVKKIGDIQVVRKKDFMETIGNYQGILRTYDQEYADMNARPSLSVPYLDTATGVKVPLWALSPVRLYQMADDIGDLRVIMETILREMFKNGAKVKPVFKYKCLECLKEFDEK